MPTVRSSGYKLPKLKVPREAIKFWKKVGEDEETIRCYSAEQFSEAVSPAQLRTFEEVKGFVADICKGDIWQSKYKGKKLTLIYGLKKGKNIAFGGIAPDGNPMIYLPPTPHGRSVHTIVHEMTHAYMGQTHGHSSRFIRTMLKFMKLYEGSFFATRLEHYMYESKALKRRAA